MGKLIYFNEGARSPIYAIENASLDPDLVGYYELKTYGETEVISENRANILEDYDQELLHAEIKRDHGLNSHQFRIALRKCLERISDEIINVK